VESTFAEFAEGRRIISLPEGIEVSDQGLLPCSVGMNGGMDRLTRRQGLWCRHLATAVPMPCAFWSCSVGFLQVFVSRLQVGFCFPGANAC